MSSCKRNYSAFKIIIPESSNISDKEADLRKTPPEFRSLSTDFARFLSPKNTVKKIQLVLTHGSVYAPDGNCGNKICIIFYIINKLNYLLLALFVGS